MLARAISVTDFSLHCLMHRLTDDPGSVHGFPSSLRRDKGGKRRGHKISYPHHKALESGRNSVSRHQENHADTLRCVSRSTHERCSGGREGTDTKVIKSNHSFPFGQEMRIGVDCYNATRAWRYSKLCALNLNAN